MITGIIVAMRKELDLLLAVMEEPRATQTQGYTFHTGKVGSRRVVAMQCGIGKVNAALGTAAMIKEFHPALIINTGVAGGTGHGASILDVVVADSIVYHDVWCGPGTEWGQAADCPPRFAPPVDTTALAAAIGAKHGTVASGDIFVSHADDLARIREHCPDTMAVDMESGAIAQTCHLLGVPMLCVRVVSDTPGAADNISQYKDFWDDAPRHTFQALSRVLERV